MKNIWVDIVRTEQELAEAKKLLLRLSEKNLLDIGVLSYGATSILRAFSDKTKIVMPVQSVYMLESLGIADDATPLESAKSLAQLVQTVAFTSRQEGRGELYMGCKDKETADYAKAHGFDELDFPMFRMRLR